MPRRKSVNFVREIGKDPIYGSEVLQKLINVVMERGKKSIARQIVYEAMEQLAKKVAGDREQALMAFDKAFAQVVPAIEVRPRRVGGSVYQIPTQVRPARARALALRWLVQAAAERSDKSMGLRLGRELLDAVEGRGNAVKKKMDVHKMAESNRAFSHYSW
ncbi:MAG TPA: 30S ribosomal protein S7 [Candidatus Babeliales bacterium]|nr:30S ribosomal protein S7 [Candidatus Babeliales bacterium]